ncbi:hypothetical protein LINPERPRIM_LOCUS9536 [Linum perenne]
MDHTIAASGARSPGLTETVVLLERSSPLTSLPSPWYFQNFCKFLRLFGLKFSY